MIDKKKWIIGVTGASGACYAKRLLEILTRYSLKLDVIFSSDARKIFKHELGISLISTIDDVIKFDNKNKSDIRLYDENDFFAPCASGSSRYEGMVIIPASMGTIGRIASGISDNLITRAADVCLKERHPLILVPRETPLSSIHLKNLLLLSELGAVVMPACPGFYTNPESIDDLVNFLLSRVLDKMGIDHKITPRWDEKTRL